MGERIRICKFEFHFIEPFPLYTPLIIPCLTGIQQRYAYTSYIWYIFFIFAEKKKMMETALSHKRKIIDLKEDTFKTLSVMAARQGMNLKRFIENLLDKAVEEYDDRETYRYLSKNYPDGKIPLKKEERKEFMDWLGVTEK